MAFSIIDEEELFAKLNFEDKEAGELDRAKTFVDPEPDINQQLSRVSVITWEKPDYSQTPNLRKNKLNLADVDTYVLKINQFSPPLNETKEGIKTALLRPSRQ